MSHQILPYLIITTFLLVEQNNFTQMNGHNQEVGSRVSPEESDHCVWPPKLISTYISHGLDYRELDYPICKKVDELATILTWDKIEERSVTVDREAETATSSHRDSSALEGSGGQQLLGMDYAEKDFLKIIEKSEESPVTPTEAPPPSQIPDKVEEEVNKSTVEDAIPSFSEWTKLQLAQRQETIINSINKNKTLQHQEGKNFASPVCGAKIRNNNPEAQNPSGIISSSNDEYMLNRCTSTIWFILELCEPLQIEKVALGNLELFASNPHEIDLEISARYPSREWQFLATFHAPDVRNVHSLILPSSSNSTFGKFLRVSIKSHHGSEHYCPLSLIRVYGKSEYEVLESESASGADADDPNPADYEGTSTFEEELTFSNRPASKSVFGAAKEAVIDMVKKAVNVLGNGNKSTNSVTTEPTLVGNNSSTCMSLIQCVDEANSSFHESVVLTLACKSHIMNWMTKYLRWCGWDYCHRFFNSYSVGNPNMPESFLVALYGPSILESICHFLHPLQSCKITHSSINGNSTSNIDEQLLELATGVPNTTLPPGSPDQETERRDSHDNKQPTEQVEPGSNPNVGKSASASTLEKKPDVSQENTNAPSPSKSTPTPSASPEKAPIEEQIQPVKQMFEKIEQIQKPQEQKQRDEQASMPEPAPTPSSFIIIEPPATQPTPAPDDQNSPGAFQQNKESVFVRLSNRIKALEINQSLSSGYLEELSRRFKKQNEDINHSHEVFRNLLNESMRRTKWLEASFRYEIRKLTRNIENLREVIYKVEVQRSGLVVFGLCQLLCTVIVFWKQTTHTCCCKRTESTETTKTSSNAANQKSMSNTQQGSEFLFRKRSNSEQYLKKVSKKKRRKELLRGGADDVFTFKTAPTIINSNPSVPVTTATTSSSSNQSACNNGTIANRIYPVANNSSYVNASTSGNGNGLKKVPSGESQTCQNQKASTDNVSDVGTATASSSKNSSATSLDKLKMSKSKSSKSFAFWK